MQPAIEIPEKLFFKIGEVAEIVQEEQHVLRYWETEFPSLAPNKSGGGQRLYTQREIDIILRIKQLLYSEGFTIAGAKKKLETEEVAPAPAASRDLTRALLDVKKELRGILDLLGE